MRLFPEFTPLFSSAIKPLDAPRPWRKRIRFWNVYKGIAEKRKHNFNESVDVSVINNLVITIRLRYDHVTITMTITLSNQEARRGAF